MLDGRRRVIDSVKLHDMVPEMALRIPDGDCEADKKTIFVVDPSEIPKRAEMTEKWKREKRISLMSNRIQELPEWPEWHDLQTLLLTGSSNIEHIPGGFFKSMLLLTVLDLSRTKIKSLPEEIFLLRDLRYLNLQGTLLALLPKEVGKLENLRRLNLDELYSLKTIPKEAMSSISRLQSLTMHYRTYKWIGGWKDKVGKDEGREVYLKDLDGLVPLEELHITVP